MANMGYRRPPYQQAQDGGTDAGWMLFCVCIAITLALAALPWIILGFVAQRLLSRWLHWRLSFLIWFVLLFAGAFALYHSYQQGLEALWQRELTDYIIAAKHSQYDLASYPLRQLWADTWPVWLHTWQGIGIAGFVGELWTNRNDTVRTLRDQERRRQRRAQRFGHRAKKRTSRPDRLPDDAKGMMIMGVPIKRDEGEENQ